jgi:hypothetical protein
MMDAARLLAANEGDRSGCSHLRRNRCLERAAQTLARLSTSLRRNGERTVLLELNRELPEQVLAAHGRLAYDAACAAMQCDRVPFAQRFEAAYAAFMASGDVAGAATTGRRCFAGDRQRTSAICEQ